MPRTSLHAQSEYAVQFNFHKILFACSFPTSIKLNAKRKREKIIEKDNLAPTGLWKVPK